MNIPTCSTLILTGLLIVDGGCRPESFDRLTEDDVLMYVAVEKRASEILDAGDARTDPERVLAHPAAYRAARDELGYRSEDLQRVTVLVERSREPKPDGLLCAINASARPVLEKVSKETKSAPHPISEPLDEESLAHNRSVLERFGFEPSPGFPLGSEDR